MIDCSTRSVRKAIIGAARALCSGATRRGKVLEFTQLVVHGDAVAVNTRRNRQWTLARVLPRKTRDQCSLSALTQLFDIN
jgi:putative ribosome biogenesis GTPase RsgA